LANNCLGVAAAGNDSYPRFKKGRPRLGPRIPALYRSILGVGATTTDLEEGAPYSNVGDVLEFGDHVSTLGGDITSNDEPLDGVVGVYSSHSFPGVGGEAAIPNETGFASWSGTSFATGIVSGLVAGFWTQERAHGQEAHAADILTGFSTLATEYTPALRTAAIGVRGEWAAA
jgi:subtilisin family serine protease